VIKFLLAYMPVLHQGYVNFLIKHQDAKMVLVFGQEIIDRFDWLKRKDIRAISPSLMCRAVASLGIANAVSLLDENRAREVAELDAKFVFADEEESRQVAKLFFQGCAVYFDSVFLRWDKPRVLDAKNAAGFPTTTRELHRKFMRGAITASERSSDWWLHVGSVLVSGDRTIVAYNKHLPSEYITYVLGDPRSLFNKGVNVELTSALHSEAAVIGRAAREGILTEGARLYVTSFPCPFCANVLAESGISELYFLSGYSMLDAAELLQSHSIQIFRVVLDERPDE